MRVMFVHLLKTQTLIELDGSKPMILRLQNSINASEADKLIQRRKRDDNS